MMDSRRTTLAPAAGMHAALGKACRRRAPAPSPRRTRLAQAPGAVEEGARRHEQAHARQPLAGRQRVAQLQVVGLS